MKIEITKKEWDEIIEANYLRARLACNSEMVNKHETQMICDICQVGCSLIEGELLKQINELLSKKAKEGQERGPKRGPKRGTKSPKYSRGCPETMVNTQYPARDTPTPKRTQEYPR